MKLIFAADLHSDPAQYDQLAALVAAERPAALLLGGDQFAFTRDGAEQVACARTHLAGFVAALRVPVYTIAGNVDWPVATAALTQLDGVHPLSLAPTHVGGLPLLGYPHVPPTPFRRQDYVRRDRSADTPETPPGSYITGPAGRHTPVGQAYLQTEPSIEDDLAALDRLDAGLLATSIWVMHGPPHGGGLDQIAGGRHVGSHALRAQIERRQPLLTLHGHIHESPRESGRWAEQIGGTLSVNPGRGQDLHAVICDTKDPAATLRHTHYGPWNGRPGSGS